MQVDTEASTPVDTVVEPDVSKSKNKRTAIRAAMNKKDLDINSTVVAADKQVKGTVKDLLNKLVTEPRPSTILVVQLLLEAAQVSQVVLAPLVGPQARATMLLARHQEVVAHQCQVEALADLEVV